MGWSIEPAGSWSTCTTDDPENELAGALAIPGAWPWHPAGAVLVPTDQVPLLVAGGPVGGVS